MLRLHNQIVRAFARSRLRREEKVDPKLKDFSSTQEVKLQIEEMRKEFEQGATRKFTEILEDPNPKLSTRFSVDQRKLSKEIRKVYKDKMSVKNLISHDGEDLAYLSASKSHLLDQEREIQFEQKFQSQLFRSKETKRLLSKKEKTAENYLEGRHDVEFRNYEQAKNKLKNNRIKNMMVLTRNNEQLQLLIESGLMNNPENLRSVIEEVKGIDESENQLLQNQGELGPQSKEQKSNDTNVTLSREEVISQISPSLRSIRSIRSIKQMKDIGPHELQETQKIYAFLENYKAMNEEDRRKCEEDLSLLRYIKQYEDKVFLSRYDALNFRFKGRVTFQFFKQRELISYVKNQNIAPRDLLTLFTQNLQKLSKFNLPILTPSVVANIYCKTSLYQFPESSSNNHINMLNDPIFLKLEKQTFKNLHKISDDDFCSVVGAYGKNHEVEQGVLRRGVAEKVDEAVFAELGFRVYNLGEENLGLALRGARRMGVMRGEKEWGEIVGYLGERLAHIDNEYTCESVFEFLVCLPQKYHPQVREICEKNLSLYSRSQWLHINTLSTFLYTSAFILKTDNSALPSASAKSSIAAILISQKHTLEHTLLPKMSLNHHPQFLTVLQQSKADVQLTRIVNLMKKLAVENIRQQKQTIGEKNLGKIVHAYALVDYARFLRARATKYSPLSQIGDEHEDKDMMRKLVMKMLLPLQVIPFNSSNYLIYHQLAKLLHSELHNISPLQLSRTLEPLSLVRYKNEEIYDHISQRILQSLHHPTNLSPPQVLQLCAIINSYALQRRNTDLFRDALQILLQGNLEQLKGVSVNYLLRVFVGIVAMGEVGGPQADRMTQIIRNRILGVAEAHAFIEEELTALIYLCLRLDYHQPLQSLISQQAHPRNPQSQWLHQITPLLTEPTLSATFSTSGLSLAQRSLSSKIEREVRENQLQIGCPIAYDQVYTRIGGRLEKEHGSGVEWKKWRVEVGGRKEVYFMGTYEHLYGREEDGKMVVGLFGIWRLYEMLYRRRGWKVRLVCTFLEGN